MRLSTIYCGLVTCISLCNASPVSCSLPSGVIGSLGNCGNINVNQISFCNDSLARCSTTSELLVMVGNFDNCIGNIADDVSNVIFSVCDCS